MNNSFLLSYKNAQKIWETRREEYKWNSKRKRERKMKECALCLEYRKAFSTFLHSLVKFIVYCSQLYRYVEAQKNFSHHPTPIINYKFHRQKEFSFTSCSFILLNNYYPMLNWWEIDWPKWVFNMKVSCQPIISFSSCFLLSFTKRM